MCSVKSGKIHVACRIQVWAQEWWNVRAFAYHTTYHAKELTSFVKTLANLVKTRQNPSVYLKTKSSVNQMR